MVLLTNETDISTNEIIDWLFFYCHNEILRLNGNSCIETISYSINNETQLLNCSTKNGEIFRSETLRAMWYRRGDLEFKDVPISGVTNRLLSISSNIRSTIQMELNYLRDVVDAFLGTFPNSINKLKDNNTNKIQNLFNAKLVGLSIPDTLITNSIKELEQFVQKYHVVITKAVSNFMINLNFEATKRGNITLVTKILRLEEIHKIMETYKDKYALPAFYQQYISKKYELRIFYLKGLFYSMAVFSQANEKTKIDFRNYDVQRPNRCVNFQLPLSIEQKIEEFMMSIDMNCGSIDMIYTPEGEYVFLEVNPVGQFQWLSKNCNYDIERQIALNLMQK